MKSEKSEYIRSLIRRRDGPLRLRSGRSTELAPLRSGAGVSGSGFRTELELSWSGNFLVGAELEWAGADSERSWSGVGASLFFYSSNHVNFSIHCSMNNVERINKRRVCPRLFIILNILLFLFGQWQCLREWFNVHVVGYFTANWIVSLLISECESVTSAKREIR